VNRCRVDLFFKSKKQKKNVQVIEILAIWLLLLLIFYSFLPAHNGDGNNQLSVG
jgi:hypothetical protein